MQENAGFAGAEAVRDANWDSGGEDGAGAGGGGGWEVAAGGLPRDGGGQWAAQAPELGRSWEDEGWEDDPGESSSSLLLSSLELSDEKVYGPDIRALLGTASGEWAIDALSDSVSLRVSRLKTDQNFPCYCPSQRERVLY